ncbi:hypothetical protein [Ponticaulis profundi]|uniref:DUF3857 domain-containing protein n=1 Tax=Ponticaulis profundi TaxID=2665222 RepID=A0ABW1SAD5_9PROT
MRFRTLAIAALGIFNLGGQSASAQDNISPLQAYEFIQQYVERYAGDTNSGYGKYTGSERYKIYDQTRRYFHWDNSENDPCFLKYTYSFKRVEDDGGILYDEITEYEIDLTSIDPDLIQFEPRNPERWDIDPDYALVRLVSADGTNAVKYNDLQSEYTRRSGFTEEASFTFMDDVRAERTYKALVWLSDYCSSQGSLFD